MKQNRLKHTPYYYIIQKKEVPLQHKQNHEPILFNIIYDLQIYDLLFIYDFII